MANPRVSVVVPLYQKARTVRRALDSIAAQRFADFEVVIVDDGSTDGGAEIAERYADPRFRVIHQENAGPGAARNRGVRESSAPYLAFLDADDAWDDVYLERMVARLDAAPETAAASCAYRTAKGTSLVPLWRRRGLHEGIFRATPATPPGLVVSVTAFLHPCTTVIRRETLLRYGGFYERGRCLYGEDAFLFLQVALNEPVAIVLETLTMMDTGASDLSTRRRPRPIEPLFDGAAELAASTPPHLRRLLRDVLAIRAGKTACVMSYWGRLADARRLLDGFTTRPDLRRRWVFLGRLSVSPLGALAARALVYLRSR